MSGKIDRYKLEGDENWSAHYNDMPALELKPGFSIKVTPPFGGALMRMTIEKGPINFSFYYDVNDSLGLVQQPYWEIYPLIMYGTERDGSIRVEEETGRYYTNEFDEMIDEMYKNTEYQEKFRDEFPEYFV